jgi:hypothetical protein
MPTGIKELPPNHVLVRFGKDVPSSVQGPCLLVFEQALRAYGIDAEVFLETMRDQNKLRRDLTRDDVI